MRGTASMSASKVVLHSPKGFICPICMEALRSAEALQVHWDAAHSSSGAGAAAVPVQLVRPGGGSGSSTPQMTRADIGEGGGAGGGDDGGGGVNGSLYSPQLPEEGTEGELEEYRSLVKKMTQVINVSGKREEGGREGEGGREREGRNGEEKQRGKEMWNMISIWEYIRGKKQ